MDDQADRALATLPVAQVAAHLHVSRPLVLRLIQRGELPATRDEHLRGRLWLIADQALTTWVQARYARRRQPPIGQAMWDHKTGGSPANRPPPPPGPRRH